jgi:hypothetical protein
MKKTGVVRYSRIRRRERENCIAQVVAREVAGEFTVR